MALADIFKPTDTEHAAELFAPDATAAIEGLLSERNRKPYIRCQVRKTSS